MQLAIGEDFFFLPDACHLLIMSLGEVEESEQTSSSVFAGVLDEAPPTSSCG